MSQTENNQLLDNIQAYLDFVTTYQIDVDMQIEDQVTVEMQTLAFQLSILLTQGVQVTVTANNSQFLPVQQPALPVEETPTTIVVKPKRINSKMVKILQAVQYYLQDTHPEPDLYMGRVFEEGVKHHWQHYQEVKLMECNNTTLARHFAIGKLLKKHHDLLKVIYPESKPEEILKEVQQELRQITKEKTDFRYQACIRIYQLFERCPSLTLCLYSFVTVTQVQRMKQTNFDWLKQEVDRLIDESIVAVAQS